MQLPNGYRLNFVEFFKTHTGNITKYIGKSVTVFFVSMKYNRITIALSCKKLTKKPDKTRLKEKDTIKAENATTAQKLSFPLRISSVNVTKSAVSSGFCHIY